MCGWNNLEMWTVFGTKFQSKIEFSKLDLLDLLKKKKTTWNSSVVTSSSILKKIYLQGKKKIKGTRVY